MCSAGKLTVRTGRRVCSCASGAQLCSQHSTHQPPARDSVSRLSLLLPLPPMRITLCTVLVRIGVLGGLAVASAQQSSAGSPPPTVLAPSGGVTSPSPGSATDCYIGNGTACVYSLGQCQVDSDCDSVLAASLAAYGIGAPPSDAEYVCYMFKCDLATPSTTCASNLNLPVCSAATPAPAPVASSGTPPASGPLPQSSASAPAPGSGANGSSPLGYAPQPPPPQAVFPARCAHSVLGTGRGCCVEFGGICRTYRDCIPSIAAYLLTLPNHVSAPPSDSLPACYAGLCYYASESTACSVLGPPLPACSDGYMCEYSTANESYVMPPPAVDVHRITAPAAPAPLSAPPLTPPVAPSPSPVAASPPPPPPPPPFSTAAQSAELSLLSVLLVAALAVGTAY